MIIRSRIITAALAATLAIGALTTSTTHAADDDQVDETTPPYTEPGPGPRTEGGESDGSASDSDPSNRAPSIAGLNGAPCSFSSVTAALTSASPGDVVHVKPGTHTTNANINQSITIAGGTSSCGPNPNGKPGKVILQTDSSTQVLVIGVSYPNPGHTVEIRGVTLRRANATSGGANLFVYGDGAHDITLHNVIIRDGNNPATGGGLQAHPGFGAEGAVITAQNTRFINNNADSGGGAYLQGVTFNMDSSFAGPGGCNVSGLPFERYCSEFIGNNASNDGGGIFANEATVNIEQSAFIANTQDSFGAPALKADGASTVSLKSVALLDHEAPGSSSGTVTIAGTSFFSTVGVTSADVNAEEWLDFDNSATGSLKRTIAMSGTFQPDQATGECNLQAPGFPESRELPGSVTANPQFFTTARSAFELKATSPAVDACKNLGATRDVFNRTVKNGDGLPSGKEYDMGAIETLRGTGFTCLGKQATIVGTNANDTINGTPGKDVIVGLNGKDTINGKNGLDRICGGDANDSLNGNGGNDLIKGDNGVDRIAGDNGNDTIDGGFGNDIIDGNNGNDTLNGNPGNDILRGGGDSDTINGNAGNDTLRGDAGADVLRGGTGSDTLTGGPGAPDRCLGQAGNDSGGGGCEIIISIP